MKITPSSAAIRVVAKKAVPAVHVGDKSVICHLTEGFSATGKPGGYGRAWTADGTFRIAVAPGEDITFWQFGFIQFQKTNDVTFMYAGREADDGGIVISASTAPALTTRTALDSVAAFTPWTTMTNRSTMNLGLVTCPTGDHPSLKAGRQLKNEHTKRQNFLFRVIDEREFWTVLTARDPLGNFQHQAHFHWKLRYDVKFNWRLDAPQVAATTSTFKSDAPAQGAPTDAVLQKLLAAPDGPQANDLMDVAIIKAVTNVLGSNRTDTTRREPFVPENFWQ